MNKIEFDLEKYNTGKFDVITGNNYPVRILSTDVKSQYPIVAAVTGYNNTEAIMTYTKDGKIDIVNPDENLNIYLVKKKWIPKENETFYYIGTLSRVFHKDEYFCNILTESNNCYENAYEAEKIIKDKLEL